MATLFQKKKMAHYEIYLDGIDATTMFKKYLNSMSFNYELNKPTELQISMLSQSYIEDLFVLGRKIKVRAGWSKYTMTDMFQGKIKRYPTGSADERMSYTVTAYSDSTSAAMEEKNKTFAVLTKTAIITQIAASNGWIPVVTISNDSIIPVQEMPIQKGMTDLEYIIELANTWNCLTWYQDKTRTLYFVSDSEAFDVGNILREVNVDDLFPSYRLGYQTDGFMNNVARLSWQFGDAKGGAPGAPGLKRLGEDGSVKKPSDYQIEFNDKLYELKPKFQAEVKKNPRNWYKYSFLITKAGVSEIDEQIKFYFVPVKGGMKTKDSSISSPSYDRQGLTLNFELNIGDPYLRPPRTVMLKAGTKNPKALNTQLPAFIMQGGNPKKYNLKSVSTKIENNIFKTEGVLKL